jgi:hypothetical protein
VPGGTLALTLPDVSSIYPRLMRRHWFYYAPSDHLHYFDPRTITRLLAEHGFAEARVTRAYKPLTLAYIALQLEQLTPALGRVAGVLVRAVPRAPRAAGALLHRRDDGHRSLDVAERAQLVVQAVLEVAAARRRGGDRQAREGGAGAHRLSASHPA